MGFYVDGFLIPIKKNQVEQYQKIAAQAGEVWREHGALDYIETVGDDLSVEGVVSFTQAAGAGEDETVIFSWILYKSKAHRDEVNAKAMLDPRIAGMADNTNLPFDCKRMAYGGFKTIVAS
ncbi:MAG: DUF1428 domain-containing protein [Gammaproteobacteria bacterium]|nr:DUF1428 domain-containing protein [Gammaproteobacteria bacterium]MBU2056337.1 DUF1428 domain-containing protein [Gammaproteobacteria bacterium]MBU2177230.1 DUF1428 domain-containing protein [Gammaproteobacteria bacterium]MBU2246132.1 DUF1428 domain-containing protein [Gammaproteobacteria bacterium]MBU2344756.1 DUF1428 domain-containing protein [Gammaproteobacteria bacterium]